MGIPNAKLRAKREATPSRAKSGESMSRSELAEAVNLYLWRARKQRYSLDADAIKRYESGKVGWPGDAYREGLRAVLDAATDAELGFHPTRRGRTPAVQTMTSPSAPQGLPGMVDLGGSPADYLAHTLVETPVPRQIGWTDVNHVRATTRAMAMSENRFGGGLSCEAAIAQLRWAGRLIGAQAAEEVRCAMFESVGNLSSVVAYSAFDIANYEAADRCFNFALWCADQGKSWALRANTLAEMSRKSAYLGNFDEALSLIELAQVRSDRVSSTARAMLCAIRARLLAVSGRHNEAISEVQRADTHFADRDPSSEPPWLCYYDEAEHLGSTGKALAPVARAQKNIQLAAARLESAIRLQGAEYPRSRTFSRIRLAALIMSAGDPREAVSIGRQAVADAVTLRSQRIATELNGLGAALEKHLRIGDVAELRQDIALLAPSGT
ncbi:XRE family transcriptional regulator [Amycolatopsis nalaikhensis]|uniref:XRE family transcriptional regulator n=1 Tax=Amycolatopsis nalaikhensis TaxID=715472 RepID=A0ABY8X931_9PSEU|nr:XRE family transcriptional regulator [Amycolatopsis sp. 2-2]WIV52897.1 XRE family transcriptional regulator [Amycolatopsis sp. 2-2]